MTDVRLADYLGHMRQAVADACSFVEGLRNRIAHGYFDIDLEIVWETVVSAFPDLQKRLNEF